MPNPNAVVDTIRSLSVPFSSLTDRAAEPPAPLSITLQDGRSATLELTTPRSRVWFEILDHLQQANRPVYVEIDPQTNRVAELLIPQASPVFAITTDLAGDVLVALVTKAAHTVLRRNNPDFQEMLSTLQTALDQGVEVLLTATRDDHEIIDVRLLPGSQTREAPPSPPPRTLDRAPTAVTAQRANALFDAMSADSCSPCAPSATCIPFRFPDDGCYARAHEMCRRMLAQGETPEKVWIYGYPKGAGTLTVKTANHPGCQVQWWYHVAPTLLVNTPNGPEKRVIDPSLCYGPVPMETWKAVQGDPNAVLEYTSWQPFWPNGGTDTNYQLTEYYLQQKRLLLKERCQDYGSPPYNTCKPDIFVRDNLQDTGQEPLAAGGISASPDINHFRQELAEPYSVLGTAVAKTQDTLFEAIEIGQPNYIYVRLQNRGNAAGAVDIDLYYAIPSTLPTPTGWHLIGSLASPPIVPGEFKVVGPLVWNNIPQQGHYCFVAVLGNPQDPKPNLAAIHTIDEFYAFIREHNNVTWKNFDVYDMFAGSVQKFEFWIQGWPRVAYLSDLEIDLAELPPGSKAELRLLKRLVVNAAVENMTLARETELYALYEFIAPAPAALRSMQLRASDQSQATLTVTLPATAPAGAYQISVLQKVGNREMGRVTKRLLVGEYPYVVNSNSDEVHLANCPWVRKMSPNHRVAYSDLELARKHGHNGCRYCLPQIDTG